MMFSILNHFDLLTDRGLKVIPLRENSKVPLCKGWTKSWDRDVARSKLQRFPDCNIGLLLGDIVDVEGDSEEANRLIADLVGNYPHPQYQSLKSVHHLFLSPDTSLRHFRWEEIEFRGRGHQSVLPPSHHEGHQYKWLKTFKFPVPEMPDKLRAFYEKKKFGRDTLKPGHVKISCDLCHKKCFLHYKRLQLELAAFKILCRPWACNKCRQVDLRPACRLLRAGAPVKIVAMNALQMPQLV